MGDNGTNPRTRLSRDRESVRRTMLIAETMIGAFVRRRRSLVVLPGRYCRDRPVTQPEAEGRVRCLL